MASTKIEQKPGNDYAEAKELEADIKIGPEGNNKFVLHSEKWAGEAHLKLIPRGLAGTSTQELKGERVEYIEGGVTHRVYKKIRPDDGARIRRIIPS